MIDFLSQIDRELFLFLNGLNAEWLDPIMIFLSGKKEMFPLYALILFLVIRKLKWQSWSILLSFVLLITIADQTASGFFKPFFERLRPCREPELQGLVNIVKGCGGKYGFASSHASNTFALAFFINLIFKNSYSRLLILWAALVSFSRIYLGVHYPGDILMGAILGLMAAIITFYLYKWLKPTHIEKLRTEKR